MHIIDSLLYNLDRHKHVLEPHDTDSSDSDNIDELKAECAQSLMTLSITRTQGHRFKQYDVSYTDL